MPKDEFARNWSDCGRSNVATSSFVANNRSRESSKCDNKSRKCNKYRSRSNLRTSRCLACDVCQLPRGSSIPVRLRRRKLLRQCAILLRRLVIRTKKQRTQSSFTRVREDDPAVLSEKERSISRVTRVARS